MKYIRTLFAAVVALVCCSAFTMKDKEKPVYAFGVAASFNDSVVFCTEIHVIDSVSLDKDGFLPNRTDYAGQLKNYLEYQQGKENYTCMVYFSENKRKLEKEAVKVKDKYKKGSGLVLKSLETSVFTFKKPQE